jgi:hypothetical protein
MVLLFKLGLGFILIFCRVPRSSPLDGPFPSSDVFQSLGFGPFGIKVHGFLHVDLRERLGFGQVPTEQLESVAGQERRTQSGRSAQVEQSISAFCRENGSAGALTHSRM